MIKVNSSQFNYQYGNQIHFPYSIASLVSYISHIDSLKKELTIKNGSGKKIDFILQELFRETSTLSVKLDHPSYKQIALDMKLSVEEMREQAQNIE